VRSVAGSEPHSQTDTWRLSPAASPPSGETILARLNFLAARRGDEVGLVAPDGAITFSEWVEESRVIAARLAELGVGVGDCVGIMLGNAEARTFTTVLTGVHLLGALGVPLNPRIGATELRAISGAIDAKVWFVAQPNLKRVRQTISDASLTHVVCVGSEEDPPPGATRFGDFQRAANLPPPVFEPTLSTPCTIAYTSGTTGTPKGVVWSHELLTLCAERMLDVLGEPYTGTPITERDVFQSPVPVFTGVIMANFLNVTMYSGCPLVLEDRFNPADAERLMARWRTTIYFGVPAIFALWNGPKPVGPQLRCLAVGGARIPPDLVSAMHERCPQAVLLNLYGTVEGGAAMIVNAGEEMLRFPTAIGRPVPPTEVAIRDGNGDVEPGSEGLLCMRSPGMMLGYRGNPAATDAIMHDGWLETPDVATMAEDGIIYLHGRKKETINRGGFKILPNEIEEAFEFHDDVEEAGVVGVPHPVLGEDIAAGVVLKAGSSVTAEVLRDFLCSILADYKVPRTIRFLPVLPRNHHGKLERSQLRRHLLA
jgi:long-chain acyl-CoA synthetase